MKNRRMAQGARFYLIFSTLGTSYLIGAFIASRVVRIKLRQRRRKKLALASNE
jgi:hypothetical protein